MKDGIVMAMNYPKYPHAKHENEFERGLMFQDMAMEELAKQYGLVIQVNSSRFYQFKAGESIQGWEFKLDDRCTDYNRLSIEVMEKSRRDMRDWTFSGILREDRTIFYVTGNHKLFYIFLRKHLQAYYRKHKPELSEKFGTIKTFYLPFHIADKMGIKIVCKQKSII